MPKPERIDVAAALEAIFKGERELRKLNESVLRAPHGELLEQTAKAIDAAKKEKTKEERVARLIAVSRVLRSVPGPKAVDLIIDVLNDDEEDARVAAGMILEDVAGDRFGEFRKGFERALKRLGPGSIALCELPFVLLGLEDVDPFPMLQAMLGHEDPEAVGATIEAFVELADPAAIALLEPLLEDARPVRLDDESTGESEQLTVGDLAADAIDALREVAGMVAPDEEG